MRQRLGALAVVLALAANACASDPSPESAATEATERATTPSAGPTASPRAEPAETGASPTELDTIVTDFLGDEGGGVIALARFGGKVELVAVGDADAQGTPLEPDTPMRVASITKPFVATMVMQLVESGDLDLDTTIDAYFDSIPLGGDVTLRQLLEHRSGLPDYLADPSLNERTARDPTLRLTPNDLLEAIAEAPTFDPDRGFSYSNTNYILAGLLVEAFDHSSLEESLQRRIAGPAGLTATHFDLGDGVPGVPGFWSGIVGIRGEPDVPYTAAATGAGAAGAMVSTAEDLLRFLDALRDGTLVAPETYARMADTASDGYGLGLAEGPMGPAGRAIGHGGRMIGFRSTMGIALESDDAVIVLTNNDLLDPEILARRIAAAW